MSYKQIVNPISKNVDENMIQRISDKAIIPTVTSNRDYQEYLKWLEEGNTPLPADEPSEGTT